MYFIPDVYDLGTVQTGPTTTGCTLGLAVLLMSSIVNEAFCVPRPSSGLACNQLVLNTHPFPSSLPVNHVLIKVDRFGFSTNNITYQALGEHPHFR